MEKPTVQEMFNRAYIGLRSQNWEQCIDSNHSCVYSDGNGRHCAWGWVDPELNGSITTTLVEDLGYGIAKLLNPGELHFAIELQDAHDGADSAEDMEARMRELADSYDLVIPPRG